MTTFTVSGGGIDRYVSRDNGPSCSHETLNLRTVLFESESLSPEDVGMPSFSQLDFLGLFKNDVDLDPVKDWDYSSYCESNLSHSGGGDQSKTDEASALPPVVEKRKEVVRKMGARCRGRQSIERDLKGRAVHSSSS